MKHFQALQDTICLLSGQGSGLTQGPAEHCDNLAENQNGSHMQVVVRKHKPGILSSLFRLAQNTDRANISKGASLDR